MWSNFYVSLYKYLKKLKMYNKLVTFLHASFSYLLLYVMIIYFLPEVILSLKWVPIDAGGAREILLTLASTQASIIAIVIAELIP